MYVEDILTKLEGEKLFLFITANEIETDTLYNELVKLDNMDKVESIPDKTNTYYVGKLGIYNVVHVRCNSTGAREPGGAILTASNAIDAWNPDAVIMVGVAFGENQKIGEVLISKTVIDYEKVKFNTFAVEERGLHVYAGPILVDRFSNFIGWNFEIGKRKVNKKAGAIISGEKLVNNAKEKKKLFERFPLAIGGDMESFGLYSACMDKGISEWIMIKGVSDLGDGKKNVNKNKRQKIAAESAVSLCKAVLSEQVFDDIKMNPKRNLKKLN